MQPSGPPIAIPTLDTIAADPRRAIGLPRAALSALLLRNAAVSTVLAAALADAQSAPAPHEENSNDRSLSVDEAAAMIGVGRRYIYRNVKKLPWVRRLSAKKLSCSEAGLKRWLAGRRA
jgi:hypothetical protein